MICQQYRKRHPEFSKRPLPKEVWDTPEWYAWKKHCFSCRECTDWTLAEAVAQRGFDVGDFPCVHLAHQVTQSCPDHEDLRDCPDVFVVYEPRFDEYLFRRGNAPLGVILFCPWCGAKLPKSKRYLWFETLEALGFDNPVLQDIPEKFLSAAWHRELHKG